jgi:hypothetical protein
VICSFIHDTSSRLLIIAYFSIAFGSEEFDLINVPPSGAGDVLK